MLRQFRRAAGMMPERRDERRVAMARQVTIDRYYTACYICSDLMCTAERKTLATHQRVGELGQGDAGAADVLVYAPAIDDERGQQCRQEIEHPVAPRECLITRLLRLALAVVHVGEGCVVHDVADDAGARHRLRAEMAQVLDRHRVAFLRHDRRDLHKLTYQAHLSRIASAF